MDDWQKDKAWSDRFIPEIQRALGEFLIQEPPYQEDAERNTDLIAFGLRPVRVGCRIRKFKYIKNYSNQFTIRIVRTSGRRTELTKIIEGWGKYLFYGFCDESEARLIQWKIIDLNVFRVWLNLYLAKNKGEIPGEQKANTDMQSEFIGFDLAKMPPEIVVKEFKDLPQ